MTELVYDALSRALGAIAEVPPQFEPELMAPAKPELGDISSNCALKLAGALRRSPRQIAADIVQQLKSDLAEDRRIESIEIAGPGFINFRFSTEYWHEALEAVLESGDSFGRTFEHSGQTALVEFVSANPTGPLTVGHGRNAVLGDTIANLLEWTGYEVTREYYYNDAGRQMRILGASVRGRYHEILADPEHALAHDTVVAKHRASYATKTVGEADTPVSVSASFPDDGYLGAYIVDIAQSLVESHGSALLESSDEAPFTQAAKTSIMADIEATLQRLGISMGSFFNEGSLYESGAVNETLSDLRMQGVIYERDGAQWMQTSAMGKDKDTVLVKQTGEPTYRLPDIAYHRNKCDRAYDVMIDIFGADHIATYPDVLRALNVLGYDTDRIKVVIYQFVTLVRGGEDVKMSTRKANYVTLDELMDDVGADVTRYFFLMRSAQSHLEFDLDLAREASDKNPVFYLQYAHARICSILQKAQEVGFAFDANTKLSHLTHEAELALIRLLVEFPDAIARTATALEPQRLSTWLRTVAEAFSRFYHSCRIIGEERALASARMALAQGTRIVLKNGLEVLGLSAPSRM